MHKLSPVLQSADSRLAGPFPAGNVPPPRKTSLRTHIGRNAAATSSPQSRVFPLALTHNGIVRFSLVSFASDNVPIPPMKLQMLCLMEYLKYAYVHQILHYLVRNVRRNAIEWQDVIDDMVTVYTLSCFAHHTR